MDPELSLRFTLTRRGLGRALTAALVCLLAPSIGSQSDPAHSVVFTTYFPAPVGAFAELHATSSLDMQLARDGGRVGIGDMGAGVSAPNSELVIGGGQASFGATSVPQGAEVINVLNGNAGILSGLSMSNRTGGARWVFYPEVYLGRQMLWFWNSANGNVFGIDAAGGGSLRMCTWNAGGCPGMRISMWRGTGGAGNTQWNCSNNNGGYCAPPSVGGSWHLCCNIR